MEEEDAVMAMRTFEEVRLDLSRVEKGDTSAPLAVESQSSACSSSPDRGTRGQICYPPFMRETAPLEQKASEGDVESKKPHISRRRCTSYRWAYLMDQIRDRIIKSVLIITSHAANHPYSYLIAVTLLSVGVLGVGFATNFDMSANAMDSYTPKDSVIWEQREWIRDDSGFPSPALSIRTVIHAEGDTVLSMEGLLHAFAIVDHVTETPGYYDLCTDASLRVDTKEHYENTGYVGGYMSECQIRGATMLWNNSLDIFHESVSSETDVLLAVNTEKYPDGSDVDTREILGKEERHWKTIYRAESLLMEVSIPSFLPQSMHMQQKLFDRLMELRSLWSKDTTSNIKLEIFTTESLELESTRAVLADTPLIAIVFFVMTVFTCTMFSSNNRQTASGKPSSHILLGLGAVLCVVFSLGTSYGLLYVIGVPFSPLTQILPFVMFGIGLDDSFIIYGEFCRTNTKKDTVQRIEDTFREVGLSIVLTKMTTAIAFALGCLSNIPTLTWMSSYAFPTVLVLAVYQLTAFTAMIVLDERRIAADRRDCCFWRGVSRNQEDDEDHAPKHIPSGESLASYNTPQTSEGTEVSSNQGDNKIPFDSFKDEQSKIDRYMGWYGDQLARPLVKAGVIAAFLAVIIGLCYSATLFTQEFDVREMLPKQSYARDYLHAMEEHGQGGWLVAYAYFRDIDQSDSVVQEEMEKFITDLSKMVVDGKPVMSEEPPFFWLRHFKEFLTYDDRLLDLTFQQQMNIFLSIGHFKSLYGDHIIRDPETGDVLASRCVVLLENIDLNSVAPQLEAWEEQINVTITQPVNMLADEIGESHKFFLYDETMIYVWEFYDETVAELIFTTVLGVLCVALIGFMFIPHWTATLYLFPIISALYVELIGFLQMFEVHLNVVSYFALIMSIGLLVDFNMHLLLRYYESPYGTRQEKVKDSLQTMGSSILMGGFSTFLGVLPLLFSSSELMTTLFYGFIGMVLLGCSHGLILLPVLLSLFGPLDTPGVRHAAHQEMPQGPVSSFSDESSTTRFMGVSFLSAESSDVDSQLSGKYLLTVNPDSTEITPIPDGAMEGASGITENEDDEDEAAEPSCSQPMDLPAPSTNDVADSLPAGALGCLS